MNDSKSPQSSPEEPEVVTDENSTAELEPELEPSEAPEAETEAMPEEAASEPATGPQAVPEESFEDQLAAMKERWMRSMAELENFRKRSRRELQTNTNLAKVQVIRELLEIVDNFGRALDSAPWEHEDEGVKAFAEGVRLIYQQFSGVLRQMGLQPINARGVEFDPNLHEAISQIETAKVPSQHVVEVVQDGYVLEDIVVRPARVIVAV